MNLKEKFLDTLNQSSQYNYRIVFRIIENLGKPITNWTEDDLDKYLFQLESISINSINKSLQHFRDFHRFVCKELELPYTQLKPKRNLLEYLDLNKLLSVTLKISHYQMIKNQLTVPSSKNGKEYNFRDKIIFMLAWEGLSNSEIRNLKASDVDFISKHEIKLHLPSDRIVTITNTVVDGISDDVVQDVATSIEERFYLRQESNGREMLVPYRDTEYLIRPIDMRVAKTDDRVSNPSSILKAALKNVICPEIDLEHLSIGDIKRSKMMYLLAMDENVRPSEVRMLWDRKTDSDLFWLKKVARKIYENDNK